MNTVSIRNDFSLENLSQVDINLNYPFNFF
jgi:hypothetical protein